MESNQTENPPSNNLQITELPNEGIPLIIHEGKKVESIQFKKIRELVNQDQAITIYNSIKQLERGDFKDSKARDENGELMLVWHGSSRKFDEFKSDAKGKWSWRNQGVHFSSSKEFIQRYAEKAQSEFKLISGWLLRRLEKVATEIPWNEERFSKVACIYNEIVKDLIENGEDSRYYHKEYIYNEETGDKHFRDPSLDYIKNPLGGRFTAASFLEIFGGKIPTKENAVLDDKFGNYGIKVYRGIDIGAYGYLTVLNIINPFRRQCHVTNIDDGFEDGESSRKQNGTDGTILVHFSGDRMLKVNLVKEPYSVAVFDPSQIRIIGREEDKEFIVTIPKITT